MNRKAYLLLSKACDDIRMEFGLDKCVKATFKRCNLTNPENIEIDPDMTIQDVEQVGTYK